MVDHRPQDIFTEPEPDLDTLANFGPLAANAGIWKGTRGADVHSAADRTRTASRRPS